MTTHRRLCLNTPSDLNLIPAPGQHIHRCKHDDEPDHDAPGVLHECQHCPATWMRLTQPAPIDLSWVTTEPVYEGSKWSWVAVAVAVLVTAAFAAWGIVEVLR